MERVRYKLPLDDKNGVQVSLGSLTIGFNPAGAFARTPSLPAQPKTGFGGKPSEGVSVAPNVGPRRPNPAKDPVVTFHVDSRPEVFWHGTTEPSPDEELAVISLDLTGYAILGADQISSVVAAVTDLPWGLHQTELKVMVADSATHQLLEGGLKDRMGDAAPRLVLGVADIATKSIV